MIHFGLLIIRLVLGISLAGHGAQKLFGWFGGHGAKGTGGFFESIGVKPGVPMAVLVGLFEFVGGLLLATGLLTWLAAVLIVIVMIGAIFKVHLPNGYFADNGGIEYPFVIIAIVVGIALIGPGAYAIG
ncbi:putative oxidoreductase [Lentibacillus persicus]|uniref:Putative oxidoreductase n=1 Tax=Lentibacillus persicus TaxID=640948 RepID=A0A1I1UF14_9BACI|nr:DoxX family protein [Lentibacillus persicus]SFD68198.1 putative oxidoreductase [Lentibacillus persicus]